MTVSIRFSRKTGLSALDICVIIASVLAVAGMLVPWLIDIRDNDARDNLLQNIREANMRGIRLAVERDAIGDTYIKADRTFTEDWTKPDGTASQMSYSLLAYAARWDQAEVVNFLIERGAEVDGKVWRNDRQPIFWAAYNGNQEIYDALIRAGADIRMTVKSKTALKYAEDGYPEAATFLEANTPEGS